MSPRHPSDDRGSGMARGTDACDRLAGGWGGACRSPAAVAGGWPYHRWTPGGLAGACHGRAAGPVSVRRHGRCRLELVPPRRGDGRADPGCGGACPHAGSRRERAHFHRAHRPGHPARRACPRSVPVSGTSASTTAVVASTTWSPASSLARAADTVGYACASSRENSSSNCPRPLRRSSRSIDSDRIVRLPYGRPCADPVTHWAYLPTLPGMTVHSVVGEGVRAALQNALG